MEGPVVKLDGSILKSMFALLMQNEGFRHDFESVFKLTLASPETMGLFFDVISTVNSIHMYHYYWIIWSNDFAFQFDPTLVWSPLMLYHFGKSAKMIEATRAFPAPVDAAFALGIAENKNLEKIGCSTLHDNLVSIGLIRGPAALAPIVTNKELAAKLAKLGVKVDVSSEVFVPSCWGSLLLVLESNNFVPEQINVVPFADYLELFDIKHVSGLDLLAKMKLVKRLSIVDTLKNPDFVANIVPFLTAAEILFPNLEKILFNQEETSMSYLRVRDSAISPSPQATQTPFDEIIARVASHNCRAKIEARYMVTYFRSRSQIQEADYNDYLQRLTEVMSQLTYKYDDVTLENSWEGVFYADAKMRLQVRFGLMTYNDVAFESQAVAVNVMEGV